MDLQITFDESLPKEFHTLAERALRTAITFLDAQPRPQATPPIESFIPEWEKLKFTVGADGWARGMYSMNSMSGWAVINVRLNGDCVFGLDKPITILNCDIELATVVECVGMLDSYFYKGIDSDRQLRRQLQYIDSIAATDGRAKSLLDQLDEQIKAEEEAEREAAYKAQYGESRRKRLARQAEARRIKPVAWYDEKYGKQETVANTSDKVVTLTPHYCTHERPAPPPPPPQLREHPTPELSEFQKQQVAQTQAMLDYVQQNAITTDTFCTNPEPSTGTEDHDM